MGFKNKAVALGRKLKLDSHHAIERFGIFFGLLVVTGLVIGAGSGVAAFQSGRDTLSTQALYTPDFTTSKTQLNGKIAGVYRNELGNRALVMMDFGEQAQISYNATDYQAFLLGSDNVAKAEKVTTDGVTGSVQVFGSTGYIGVLLEAKEPFERQVLNLTMRANAELSFAQQLNDGQGTDALAGDKTFAKYDQWRVFFNPAASDATHITALDTPNFDAGRAYYDIVLQPEEKTAREKLEAQLVKMRADLTQIASYTSDLQTTKVDGVFLRPATVPEAIRDDQVVGQSTAEIQATTPNAEGTLALETKTVVPRGYNFDWRNGSVYEGYLDALVPHSQGFAAYLANKAAEPSDRTNTEINNLPWILSDGTDLKKDYRSSDVTIRPLVTVMNNLSQAYQNYVKDKSEYQTQLLPELLELDVELRNVRSNTSVHSGDEFLTTLR